MLNGRSALVLTLLLGSLFVGNSGYARRASADDATVTVLPASPEPTVAVATVALPTIAPPVVRQEHTPVPSPTSPPVVRPTMPPTPIAIPRPTATLPAPTAPLSYGSAGLDPSPAELRLSARLRWGKHVPAEVRRWAFLIVPAARRYHVDPNLVAAVMTMESGGDPRAVSGADARGLMQVLHGSFDPAENIDSGISMLAQLLAEFHDVSLALAAYNAGPGAVIAYGGIPPYRETRDYVIIVTYLYDLYGHRVLTPHRRAQYSSTLHDLRRFKNQRKKVKLLSTAATVKPTRVVPCGVDNPCEKSFDERVFPTLDPFWPMPGPPDPLQRVGPVVPRP